SDMCAAHARRAADESQPACERLCTLLTSRVCHARRTGAAARLNSGQLRGTSIASSAAMNKRLGPATMVMAAALVAFQTSSANADTICEARVTECRGPLLAYINRELMGIDVGMEEMEDAVIADAIIARFKAHVPVRMIVEPRRNAAANLAILSKLKTA